MAKGKTVNWQKCPCGKRGFADEHTAAKALGKARASRARVRGAEMESRYYPCDLSDLYHLTGQSRRSFESYNSMLAAA